jgi:hypothetical protein
MELKMSNFTVSLLSSRNGYEEIIGKETGRNNYNGISQFISEYGSGRYIYKVKGIVIAAIHIQEERANVTRSICDSAILDTANDEKYIKELLMSLFKTSGKFDIYSSGISKDIQDWALEEKIAHDHHKLFTCT